MLTRFLEHGLIRPCRSPCNISILLVKKPHTNEYQFVQDLRAINEIVQDIHPTNIPGDYEYFTIVDLKDAFFCIPVEEESQLLFAFEWKDPRTKAISQGRRYKCLICHGYDLCASCYESDATIARHTTDHPMQHILTRVDVDLYYGGEASSIEQPQSL